jgi:hypothetical protein
MATAQLPAPAVASEHLSQTVQASVMEPPTKQEVVLDAALVVAGVAEFVSPPVAVAGFALNRLVHHAK